MNTLTFIQEARQVVLGQTIGPDPVLTGVSHHVLESIQRRLQKGQRVSWTN